MDGGSSGTGIPRRRVECGRYRLRRQQERAWGAVGPGREVTHGGRFGQRLYVSPQAEIVIAQFSSAPGSAPHPFDLPLARLQNELAHRFI